MSTNQTANKYRVHEVAKDLAVPTKDVVDVLSKYAQTPKNHMQVLSDQELSYVFDALTQKHKCGSIMEIFAEPKKPEPKPEPKVATPKAEPKVEAKPESKAEPKAVVKAEPKAVEKVEATPVETPKTPAPQAAPQAAPAAQQQARPQGDRPQGYQGNRPQGDRPQGYQGNRPQGDRPQGYQGNRPQGDRPQGYQGNRPQGDRPQGYQGNRPQGDRPQGYQGNRPQGDRPQGYQGNRPQGDRPQGYQGNRPQGDRPQGGYQQRDGQGYQGNRPQGGYQQRDGQGYQGNRPQGGYQQRDGQGYQGNRPQGGYNNQQGGYNNNRPQGGYNNQNRPNNPPAPPRAPAPKPVLERPTTRVPEKKIVDTRKGGDINLAKYDERLETLAPQAASRMGYQQGKEKFRNTGRQQRPNNLSNKRRQEEQDRLRRLQLEVVKKTPLKVQIPDEISVGELASRMKKTGAEVVKELMKNGIMASLSQVIDFDTAELVATELGCKVEKEVVITIEERLIDDRKDDEGELQSRAPVVVVMGHVDHGKTSLLDAIRNADVASGEAGGITQHIGAYQVQIGEKPITFLDTPGHEAFTSMRARGAMITDIAILMVAADDGIMPQTIESINHAKAAEIPIIVAINKIDKPGANPDKVMQQLTEHGLQPEDWGGTTICCQVSAKKRTGIENLLEMVTLTAEMEELKANPDRAGQGTVIEARLDKGRGPVATLLVQNGTLKQGDVIIAGTAVGRVRAMVDHKGRKTQSATPSVPVEITGLSEAPAAGSQFFAVADERMARELVEQRKAEERLRAANTVQKVSLENLFDQIQAGERKELPLIVKGDVQGSVEALKSALQKLSNDEVNVRVIHSAVGAISESDVMLASSSGAIIVGFNVRPDAAARDSGIRSNVDMRMYRIIYDCINEIESAMKGMLAPEFKEQVLGHAIVRQTYKVSTIGTIAGCYVQDGKIVRACSVRVVRDGIVIHEGSLSSLQRFKDSVKEVADNYECGLTVEKFNDIREEDIIEAFTMVEIPR